MKIAGGLLMLIGLSVIACIKTCNEKTG